MNKEEFLTTLRSELEKKSVSNIDNMIEYYDEMICDRIEDGMSEEDAINSMDSISTIVNEAVLDKTIPTLMKEKVSKSRKEAKANGHSVLWIVLAILGFPIWLPLLLTFGIVIFVLFVLLWVLVLTCFIVLISFALAAVACLALPFFAFSAPSLFLCIGAALVLGGLTVLLWKPICACAKALTRLIADFLRAVKRLFV